MTYEFNLEVLARKAILKEIDVLSCHLDHNENKFKSDRESRYLARNERLN